MTNTNSEQRYSTLRPLAKIVGCILLYGIGYFFGGKEAREARKPNDLPNTGTIEMRCRAPYREINVIDVPLTKIGSGVYPLRYELNLADILDGGNTNSTFCDITLK